MILGPVCHFELVRIARQRRFFFTRLAFGLILFTVIGVNFLFISPTVRSWFGEPSTGVSIHELSMLGYSLFFSMMAAQAALVMGLTPALVADAIASERQRKTLQDLLTTRLTSPSIVLGKVGARLTGIATFIALVLPIASLLTLFGGFSPESLLWGDAALAATAYFLAGLSILASVLARRPRDAVGASYTVTMLLWVFLPMLFGLVVSLLPSTWAPYIAPANMVYAWVWPASPLGLITDTKMFLGGGSEELRRWAAWLIASQFVHGTILLALASWQLRPAYRRQEGRAGRRSKAVGPRWRIFSRRPCGDEPIYWKEAHVARGGGGILRQLGRLVLPLLLALAVGAVLYGAIDEGAFTEAWAYSYRFIDFQTYTARFSMNMAVRYIGTLIIAFWMLRLGSHAASGISVEREQDTWISLLATPLDGDEILRGKMLGALRTTAPFGAALGSIWLIGLACGAIHPLGLILAVSGLALFAWYATALGTFFSLKAKTTWRAQGWTQSILIAPHLCCYLPLPAPLLMMAVAPLSYSDIHGLPELIGELFKESWWACLLIAYVFGGIAVYVVAAYFLTRASFRQFDDEAGRPRRRPMPKALPELPVID